MGEGDWEGKIKKGEEGEGKTNEKKIEGAFNNVSLYQGSGVNQKIAHSI